MDELKAQILSGKYPSAYLLYESLTQSERESVLYSIAFDNNILAYGFCSYILIQKPTAENHSLASSICQIGCLIDGAYTLAYHHGKEATRLSDDIKYKEQMLLLYEIPDIEMSVKEVLSIAREILEREPNNVKALSIVNRKREALEQKLLWKAQSGDIDSMRELGLRGASIPEEKNTQLDGLEWLRLAAACGDRQAQSAIEHTTKKAYNHAWEELGRHVEGTIISIMVVAFILILWKLKSSLIGASMLLVSLVYWLRISFAHYYEFENSALKMKMGQRLPGPKRIPTFSSVISYLMLGIFLTGYILVMLQYRQRFAFSLPLKVGILLLFVLTEVDNFRTVLMKKRKIVKYDQVTTKLAELLRTSRLRLLILQYMILSMMCIILTVVIAIVV